MRSEGGIGQGAFCKVRRAHGALKQNSLAPLLHTHHCNEPPKREAAGTESESQAPTGLYPDLSPNAAFRTLEADGCDRAHLKHPKDQLL